MANIRRNFYLLILIENLYSFYNTATVVIGVVFFYNIFGNVLLATLPLIISHTAYALLVKQFATWGGRIGSRKSLSVSMFLFALSPVPILAYYNQPEVIYLVLWFIVYYLAKLFFHTPLLYMYGQVTSHDRRGSEISFKRISVTVTNVLTPLITGVILDSFGFAAVVIFATLIVLLALIPMWLLPDVYYQANTSFKAMIANLNIRQLWMLNMITELHVSGSDRIWVIYLFIVLAESYLNLGILISLTTLCSIILLFLFGRLLDNYNRIRTFRITTMVVAFADIMRAIPLVPFAVTDTYNRVSKGIQMQTAEVVNFDLMNDDLELQQRDELVVAREVGINIAIAASYLFVSLLVITFGFQFAFLATGTAILVLTRRFK